MRPVWSVVAAEAKKSFGMGPVVSAVAAEAKKSLGTPSEVCQAPSEVILDELDS
jgi:hypothetical protein